MTNEQFQEAMQSGLGRAILYARDHDVRLFRDTILDACLNCYSIDTQTEGTRAGYMFELVNNLPDREFYFDAVLKQLAKGGDDWHTVQRFHFAACMYFDGDTRAKQLMYESFKPGPKTGEAIAIDFLRMDGLNGFLFAAAKIGALLLSSHNKVDEGWLWSTAIEFYGEEESKAALLQAGAEDSCIEAYRVKAIANREETSRAIKKSETTANLSYEQLRAKIHNIPAYKLRSWGKQASSDDIQQAAYGLLTAESPPLQVRYLRIFSGRPFPLEPVRLLDLLRSQPEDLVLAAAIALSQVEHPALREVAFQLVSDQSVGRWAAIAILDRNWKPGDHGIALSWFDDEGDRAVRHSMGLDLMNVCDSHPDPQNELHILQSLYEHGSCSSCRERVVKRLIKLDSLPELLLAECAYDANEDIRALVARE